VGVAEYHRRGAHRARTYASDRIGARAGGPRLRGSLLLRRPGGFRGGWRRRVRVVPTLTPFFLSASLGFVFAIFTFSVVGGFGLGRGWVQIGPEGISGLTYRGRRVFPWQEARFVEWIPYLGGYRAFGLNVPALAAYRERPSETGSRRAEPLMYLRMRLIVTRRQQVAVARQFFEACRGYGASTSVHEEMLREIEK
jgi:hypothetical protein